MYRYAYDPSFFSRMLEEVAPLLRGYMEDSQREKQKVLLQKSISEIQEELGMEQLIREGGGDLSRLVTIILENSNHLWDPRYIGHQVAVPMAPAALGDLLNGAVNNPIAVYEMGPAATAIERGLISWLLDKTGWSPNGDGIMTHGGSMVNLTCLLAARASAFPGAWQKGTPPQAALIASEASHYSIARAASIIGLGSDAVFSLPVDEHCRIRVSGLEGLYHQIQATGRKVIAVVINDCVTASGTYDPIAETARFCRREGLWLHVDGAHGASVLLSPKYRYLMDGIELADSLTWDAHKMMGTSGVCGIGLFRKKEALGATFSQQCTYLYTEADRPGIDTSERTLECTKSMMALKLFFNLAVMGEKGLAEHVTTLYDNARKFYRVIEAREGFHCLCPPEANIICFSCGEDSKLQDAIRQKIVAEGDFYITRATAGGKSYLRLSVMNPLTSEEHITRLCDRIEELAMEASSR